MQKHKNKQTKRKPRSGPSKLNQLSSLAAPSLRREIAFGFPARKRLTLKYADTYGLASTTGSVATQQFRVNSLFDPDLTNTGHQPRGFDQWCSATGPYQNYRVLEHRAVVKAIVTSNNTVDAQIVAGYSDLNSLPSFPSGSSLADVSGQTELRGWKGTLLPVHAPVTVMKFDARIAEIEGVSESVVLSEDNYMALYNANPADLAYFSIQAMILDSNTGQILVQVEHEFDVQFEQPILLAPS